MTLNLFIKSLKSETLKNSLLLAKLTAAEEFEKANQAFKLYEQLKFKEKQRFNKQYIKFLALAK